MVGMIRMKAEDEYFKLSVKKLLCVKLSCGREKPFDIKRQG